MSRVGGKIRVGRVTPIQQFFFFFGLSIEMVSKIEVGMSTTNIYLH